MANFKYKQVERWIRDEITAGRFKPGSRIPTEPELMELFNVSRKTIRSAVDHLTADGLLHRIQGSGTYISDSISSGDAAATDTYASAYPLPGPAHAQPGATPAPAGAPVALVMMDSNNYIFPEVMRGASEVLAQNGYSLNVYFTDNNYETELNVLHTLQQQSPAGIIAEPAMLGSLFLNHETYCTLAGQIPTILIHHDQPDVLPAVPLLDRAGGRVLADYLIGQGHTSIGTIYFMNENTAYGRYLGFIDSLRAHGQQQSNNLSIWTERQKVNDLFEPGGSLALERMLGSATAVICHDDRVAYALITYLQRRDIRVPEDISVAGYDDSFFATLNVPITTVSHPKDAYGRNAAHALLARMRGETPDLQRYAIEPRLVIRSSVSNRL